MGWIGVDLDGTLAYLPDPGTVESIGEPIPLMLERVKKWLSEGREVRIVTARVGATGRIAEEASGLLDDVAFAASQHKMIAAWCWKHIGQYLPITAQKDFAMIELWDDRAVTVEKNTGVQLAPCRILR